MFRRQYSLMLLAVCMGLGGCATVTTGTQQSFEVLVQGADTARCEIEKAGASPLKVTPGTPIKIPRSDSPLHVHCDEQGYQSGGITVAAQVQTRANYEMPFGMLVDYLSGARYEYPAQVTVTLTPLLATARMH